MKLVLIVPSFPKLSESFIVNKFLGLLSKGYDVHVVCQVSEKEETARFSQLNDARDARSRVHRTYPLEPRWIVFLLLPCALLLLMLKCPLRTVNYFISLRGVGLCEAFRRVYLDAPLIELNPDILHYEFGTLGRDKMYLRQALQCRIVVSFRGFDISYVGLDDRDYFAEIWLHADRLHFLGEDLLDLARARGYGGTNKHVLIPPAIDAEFFTAARECDNGVRGAPGRPLRVVSVGRLTWKKGYEFALASVSRIVQRGLNIQYVIVGDGEFFEAVAFAVHQFGLEAMVTLSGAQRPEGVREAMARADVFLHAAVSEGFCNAVLEAQSMCLPVVSSDAAGLHENVLHEITGFITPRRNPVAMADCLERLAKDPALREQMGRMGRERVLTQFRLADQIEKFASMYTGMMNEMSGNSNA
jgi:colanic acid/amylovoran biosynthesis glycosyltransferase